MYYVPRQFFKTFRYWFASVGLCNGGWVQLVLCGWTLNLRWTKGVFKRENLC